MLRIAFGSLLLISGLSGRLALVSDSASRFLAYLGAAVASFGLLALLRNRRPTAAVPANRAAEPVPPDEAMAA